jgi:hypothetical protein
MTADNSSALRDDAADTLRPPRCSTIREELTMLAAMDRLSSVRIQTFPVTIHCETEEQRAELVAYLAELGFHIEEHP